MEARGLPQRRDVRPALAGFHAVDADQVAGVLPAQHLPNALGVVQAEAHRQAAAQRNRSRRRYHVRLHALAAKGVLEPQHLLPGSKRRDSIYILLHKLSLRIIARGSAGPA